MEAAYGRMKSREENRAEGWSGRDGILMLSYPLHAAVPGLQSTLGLPTFGPISPFD